METIHKQGFVPFAICLGLAILLFAAVPAAAQCDCDTVPLSTPHRVEYRSSYYDPLPTYKTYKIEYERQFVEEEVTSYETVWETQLRQRKVTVARPVRETSMREERYKTLKPVWETFLRDDSYDIVRQVPETSYQERRTIVNRPVIETENREIWQTVRRPVQETIMQERAYTVNRPITELRTQVVDRGGYVDSVNVEAGRTYNRLTWQRGGTYLDPVSGKTLRHLPGLYWTPMESAPKYHVNKVYQSNYVAEQVPVTTLVPETVVEQVPVSVTTFKEEKVLKIQPVTVQRMVQEEVVESVPVRTYKQIVERVEKKTPVRVQRMETEEVVRQIPVTTFKTVYEDKIEEYEVSVPRQVAVVKTVQKPVLVRKQIPITSSGIEVIEDRMVDDRIIGESVVGEPTTAPHPETFKKENAGTYGTDDNTADQPPTL